MSKEYCDSGRWAMWSLGCRVSYSSGVRVEKVSFITELIKMSASALRRSTTAVIVTNEPPNHIDPV